MRFWMSLLKVGFTLHDLTAPNLNPFLVVRLENGHVNYKFGEPRFFFDLAFVAKLETRWEIYVFFPALKKQPLPRI